MCTLFHSVQQTTTHGIESLWHDSTKLHNAIYMSREHWSLSGCIPDNMTQQTSKETRSSFLSLYPAVGWGGEEREDRVHPISNISYWVDICHAVLLKAFHQQYPVSPISIFNDSHGNCSAKKKKDRKIARDQITFQIKWNKVYPNSLDMWWQTFIWCIGY